MSYLTNPYRYATGGDPQVTNIFNEANYTWATAGASGSSITSGDDPTGYGTSAGGVGSPYWRRAKTTITSGNTKTFEWKFTWTRNSGDQANNSILTLANFDWADTTPTGNEKNIKFQTSNTDLAFWRAQTATGSNQGASPHNDDFLQAVGTTRYYSVTGDGTTWKAESWDNSARTTDLITTDTTSPSGIGFPSDWLTTDTIDNVIFGAFGGDSSDFTVSEVSVSWDGGE